MSTCAVWPCALFFAWPVVQPWLNDYSLNLNKSWKLWTWYWGMHMEPSMCCRKTLKRSGERRQPCRTPIVVANHSMKLLFIRMQLLAFLYRSLMMLIRILGNHIITDHYAMSCMSKAFSRWRLRRPSHLSFHCDVG